MMLPPAGYHSCPELFTSQPSRSVKSYLGVYSDLSIIYFRCRSEPHIIVQVFWYRHLRSFGSGRIARETYFYSVQLSYPSVSDKLGSISPLCAGPLLSSNLKDNLLFSD